MSVSIYDVCFPTAIRTLENIAAVLDKAIAHCAARKIDPTVLAGYRLAADMLPLSKQVQIMTDQVKGMGARLAGVEVPSYPDTETTLEELKARVEKTAAFLKTIKADQVAGSEDRPVVLKFGPREMKFDTGLDYVLKSVFPNFYFHATTTYDILRHVGVDIGKRDFLGA
jgi:hypothetical protein